MQFVAKCILLGLCVPVAGAQMSVTGKVVDSLTGAPVAGAEIRINLTEKTQNSVASDSTGAFQISGVVASGGTVVVIAPGYITRGAEITYAAGAHQAYSMIQMVPEAVIVGRVTNADGHPMIDAAVCAMRYTLVKGARIPARERCVATKSGGMYRLGQLPAGRYYVRVGQLDPQSRLRSNWDARDVPTMHPDLLQAASGETHSGVDIRVDRRDGVSVSGKLLGIRAPGDLNVSLQSADMVELVSWMKSVIAPDGSFRFPHVAPGDYVLKYGSPLPKPGQVWGEMPVRVGSSPMEGLQFPVQPAQFREITGTVNMPDGSSPGRLQIILAATYPGSHIREPYRGGGTTTDDAGAFKLSVLPGRYDIEVRPVMVEGGVAPFGLPLESANWGGDDVAVAGFDVAGATPTPLRITLPASMAAVNGHVVGEDGRGITRATLLLAPVNGQRAIDATSSLLGNFHFSVPAGDYFVYAQRDVNRAGTLEDAEYLRAHATDRPVFHAVAGSNAPLELKVH